MSQFSQAMSQAGVAQCTRPHIHAAAGLAEIHGNADDANGGRHGLDRWSVGVLEYWVETPLMRTSVYSFGIGVAGCADFGNGEEKISAIFMLNPGRSSGQVSVFDSHRQVRRAGFVLFLFVQVFI
jgi:hypothetical protein